MTRAYPHPPHGTCVAGCPSLGRCHCGCGRRTKRSPQTRVSDGYVKGAPYRYIVGHAPSQRAPLPPGANLGRLRHMVPVGRVAPLVDWLHSRVGPVVAAELVGCCRDTLYLYRKGKVGRVPKERARAIASLVLSMRRPGDPLRLFELPEPPRRPLLEEQQAAYRDSDRTRRRALRRDGRVHTCRNANHAACTGRWGTRSCSCSCHGVAA